MKRTQKVTYAEFKAYYLKYVKRTYRELTLRNYISVLGIMENFKKPKYLSEITPAFLSSFQRYLRNYAKKHDNKPKPVTRNNYITNIKAMMNFAARRGYAKKQDWGLLRFEPAKIFRSEYHSIEELTEIKNMLYGDLLTCFLLGTQEGLRRGEIANLEKSDYDPQRHSVHIRSKPWWQTKTISSEREVPLQPESEAAIIESIKNAPEKSSFIINFYRKRKKKKTSETYITYQYKIFFRKHLPHIKSFPHKLRHTFASCLLQNNAELKAVSELMGHSNILTTSRYAHLEFKDRVRAASHMPKF